MQRDELIDQLMLIAEKLEDAKMENGEFPDDPLIRINLGEIELADFDHEYEVFDSFIKIGRWDTLTMEEPIIYYISISEIKGISVYNI